MEPVSFGEGSPRGGFREGVTLPCPAGGGGGGVSRPAWAPSGTLAGGGHSGLLSWTGRWVDSWGQTREPWVLAEWPTRWSEGSWKDGGCGLRENDAGGRGAIRRPLWSSRHEMTTPKGDKGEVVILLLVLARFFGVLKQGYFSGRTLKTTMTGRAWFMWPQRGCQCLPFDLQPRWNCRPSSSGTCRCKQCHVGRPRVSQPGGSLGPLPGVDAC